MMMQTMSGGGIGSGVASAISRALGGGRRDDANALVLVSLVIAACFGMAFTAAVLLGGRTQFAAMGGTGIALDLADTYAWILFSGALVFWIFNTLGSILRGAGIMSLPAIVSVIGAVMTLTVSPTLIMGLGPVPRLGIARCRPRNPRLLHGWSHYIGLLPPLGPRAGQTGPRVVGAVASLSRRAQGWLAGGAQFCRL